MSRVAWSEIAPDDFERILAVLLGNRFRNAQQVRASRGDRGIDVYVPAGDRLVVYQAKRYSGDLTPKRKAEILSSLATVADSYGEGVQEWHLLLAIVPTPEMLDWFAESIQSVRPFPCYWHGTDYIDGLAAESPHVLEYYLGDGRRQLEQQLEAVGAALDLRRLSEPGAQLRAADVTQTLMQLSETINSTDPHFEYSIEATPRPPTEGAPRGAVYSQTISSGNHHVRLSIFERYRGALEHRPIPLTVTTQLPEESLKRLELQDFYDYGTPLTLGPEEQLHVEADLPGGLSIPTSGMSMRFSPTAPNPSSELQLLRFDLDDPDYPECSVTVRRTGGGVGTNGGGHLTMRDLAGLSDFEVRIPPQASQAGRLSLNRNYGYGIAANTVAGPLRLAVSIASGARFRLTDLSTGRELLVMRLSPDSSAMEGIEEDLEMCEFVEDLASLQPFSSSQLVVPTEMSPQTVGEVAEAARWIRGETSEFSWNTLEAVVRREFFEEFVGLLDGPQRIEVTGEEIIDLGYAEIRIPGVETIILSAVVPEPPELPAHGDVTVNFQPGTSELAQRRRVDGAASSDNGLDGK